MHLLRLSYLSRLNISVSLKCINVLLLLFPCWSIATDFTCKRRGAIYMVILLVNVLTNTVASYTLVFITKSTLRRWLCFILSLKDVEVAWTWTYRSSFHDEIRVVVCILDIERSSSTWRNALGIKLAYNHRLRSPVTNCRKLSYIFK